METALIIYKSQISVLINKIENPCRKGLIYILLTEELEDIILIKKVIYHFYLILK